MKRAKLYGDESLLDAVSQNVGHGGISPSSLLGQALKTFCLKKCILCGFQYTLSQTNT